MKYEVIIWWSEKDQVYLAEVPELPGCLTDGPSHAAALENLDEVAALWLDTARNQGRTIPEPLGRLRYA